MALSPRIFRIPRPRTFLYLMSLRTGTELITVTILLNKLSGVYGLLAVLTGLSLSPTQLSMYIWSCLALGLTAVLAPHVRKQSPLQCLALAWFYIIDSAINAAYTAIFSITWFMVVSQHHSKESGSLPPGGKTIDDTAGFTNGNKNISHVDVYVTPNNGIPGGHDAIAVGKPGAGPSATSPSLGHGVLQPESIPSIVVITGLWLVRVYFILVVMAYARSVLRMHMYNASTARLETDITSDAQTTDSPFNADTREGQGWQGKLGRLMVSVGRNYWLGSQEDNSWMRRMGGKFKKNKEAAVGGGPQERERRRRSGTGPPPPPQQA